MRFRLGNLIAAALITRASGFVFANDWQTQVGEGLGKVASGDWLTVLIAAARLAVLFRWKVSNPLLVGATAVIGLIAFPLLQPAWVMVR